VLLGISVLILALPWTYALCQRPRQPFVYSALIGGMIGAVMMGLLVGRVDFLSLEYGLARSAAAVLLLGGPLGSLLGQAVVALFVPPTQRRIGAVMGWLIGPFFGWPLLYLFPADDPRLWHGPFWVAFWLGSWAGWCALNGAYLGVWCRTWTPGAQFAGKAILPLLVLPAVAVGAWNFEAIRLHVTPVAVLAQRHDAAGVVWKMDHGEELAQAVALAGEAAEGMDPALEARLTAVLAGTFEPMIGRITSDTDYRAARLSAARSLGRIHDSHTVQILLQYASDSDPQVRQAMLLALVDCPQPQARAAARAAAEHDPDQEVRRAVREALRARTARPPVP
jgi:hypothetical protein